MLACGAEHVAAAPPLKPEQVQFHGPEPVTIGVALVILQRFVVGALDTATPLADPHSPPAICGAEHDAVVPAPPLHVQLYEKVPIDTGEVEPLLHRPVVGAFDTATPLAAPH